MIEIKTYENFVIKYTKKIAVVEFEIYEIIAGFKEGDNWFEEKENSSSYGMTNDIQKANVFISGTVKWDGCSHLNFGDEDGYLHLCGSYFWKKLISILEVVYKECCIIGEFDYDLWDKK